MSQITLNALAESLKKNMQTIPLAKITVNDIVSECGLNRKTLYYHFHDIYDLLEWIFITEIRAVLSNNRAYSTWQKGFADMLKYLHQNKKIVLNTYNSIKRDILENHLYSELFNLIFEVVNELSSDLEVSDEDKKYVTHIYKILFTGVIIDWIKNDMIQDPDDLVIRFNKLISGEIYRALLKYAHT